MVLVMAVEFKPAAFQQVTTNNGSATKQQNKRNKAANQASLTAAKLSSGTPYFDSTAASTLRDDTWGDLF
jgi:hypothetical protein